MTITITVIIVNKYIKKYIEKHPCEFDSISYKYLSLISFCVDVKQLKRSQTLSQNISVSQWRYQINMLIT